MAILFILLKMDWKSITISGTNEPHTSLISIIIESNGKFVFQMTDFKVLWREKIDWMEILLRAKVSFFFLKLNVVIQVPSLE